VLVSQKDIQQENGSKSMLKRLKIYFPARQKGQSLAEYGLIIALVAVICLASLRLFGQNLGNMFNGIADSIGKIMTASTV
jgi:Flp pilus assembly pilin Flp